MKIMCFGNYIDFYAQWRVNFVEPYKCSVEENLDACCRNDTSIFQVYIQAVLTSQFVFFYQNLCNTSMFSLIFYSFP